MSKTHKIILIIITLISFCLRFYQANNYPPLLWDEAAIGYNAYSILKTGRDEHGQLLPLIFKSFGDYKPGIYIYLTVPFVAIFGLTPLAVRLPSILIGSLMPLFLYFLIKAISPKSDKVALISAILLTFNPWNLHFSRGAWETNILTFQLILASLLFLKKKYFPSAIIFALGLYTYQAGKMIAPLIIFSLLVANFKTTKKDFKNLLTKFIFPLFILSLPIIYGLLFSQDSNRLKVLSLTSYPRSNEEKELIIKESSQFDYTLFHSQPIFFLRNFCSRYFNHFSTRFLFFEGDWQNLRHSAPYIGVLLYPSLIFLVIGLLNYSSTSLFFLLWLVFAPIPGALTRDTVTAVRTLSMSIPLIYFIALGLNSTLTYLKKYSHLIYSSSILLIFFSFFLSFLYYQDLYYYHLVKKDPIQLLYGYQQAIDFVVKNKEKYKDSNIYFTDFYGQPYIYYLFYTKYPPQIYQQQSHIIEGSNGDTGIVRQIDNLYFRTAHFDFIKENPHTLGIFAQEEVYRQNLESRPEFKKFIPLSPINTISTFYAYEQE